ncbi:MAG: hypothetical protein E7505_07805 [Ruminococcus sp.]|jgi:hypothetical protein|nr:hypothetical protein [Ruminococcus sp.]
MSDNEAIKKTVARIQEICDPLNIILVSNKVNTDGEIVSFKLVVVVNDSVESTPELECRLYMQIDCEIPYDIVLYKLSEWNRFKNDIGTFAWKIYKTGAYLYGEKL